MRARRAPGAAHLSAESGSFRTGPARDRARPAVAASLGPILPRLRGSQAVFWNYYLFPGNCAVPVERPAGGFRPGWTRFIARSRTKGSPSCLAASARERRSTAAPTCRAGPALRTVSACATRHIRFRPHARARPQAPAPALRFAGPLAGAFRLRRGLPGGKGVRRRADPQHRRFPALLRRARLPPRRVRQLQQYGGKTPSLQSVDCR